MKIATWNVNGIRKRQAEFTDWIARERDGYEACAISTDRQLVMSAGFARFMTER